jgi:hypothetical protein
MVNDMTNSCIFQQFVWASPSELNLQMQNTDACSIYVATDVQMVALDQRK